MTLDTGYSLWLQIAHVPRYSPILLINNQESVTAIVVVVFWKLLVCRPLEVPKIVKYFWYVCFFWVLSQEANLTTDWRLVWTCLHVWHNNMWPPTTRTVDPPMCPHHWRQPLSSSHFSYVTLSSSGSGPDPANVDRNPLYWRISSHAYAQQMLLVHNVWKIMFKTD